MPQLLICKIARDVFNMDETGLNCRDLLDKPLAVKDQEGTTGKELKHELTMLLCLNQLRYSRLVKYNIEYTHMITII